MQKLKKESPKGQTITFKCHFYENYSIGLSNSQDTFRTGGWYFRIAAGEVSFAKITDKILQQSSRRAVGTTAVILG